MVQPLTRESLSKALRAVIEKDMGKLQDRAQR